MKLWSIFGVILMVAVSIPNGSFAFDDERPGFMLGVGVGYGIANVSSSGSSTSNYGVPTVFKIGGGVSEKIMVHYSNRVVFFTEGSTSWHQGISAVGATYFLNPMAPSFSFSGEVGVGVLDSFETGISGETGIGFCVGVGYEFLPHSTVEFNYMSSSVGDSALDLSVSNYTITVNRLFF